MRIKVINKFHTEVGKEYTIETFHVRSQTIKIDIEDCEITDMSGCKLAENIILNANSLECSVNHFFMKETTFCRFCSACGIKL